MKDFHSPASERCTSRSVLASLLATACLLAASPSVLSQEQPGVEPDREQMYAHLKRAREIAGADLYAHYVHRCIIDQTYRRTLSRGVQARGAIPATRVFDNLYFVGENSVSAWALDTGDGIILFDALHSADDISNIVEPGLRKFGLDPANIRYLVITHAHGDHFGGAKYLAGKYGTRVMASATDWKEMQQISAGPPNWRDLVPARDLEISDGQEFRLGKARLSFFITPGHTPGTVSTVFEVTDGAARHTVGYFGGLGTPASAAAKLQLIQSLENFKKVARDRKIDVLIANHQTQDQAIPKLEELRLRRTGDPNPYVIGNDRYVRYLSVQQECTKFAMAQQGQSGAAAQSAP
jgi:metallo-beta-lactamase class B